MATSFEITPVVVNEKLEIKNFDSLVATVRKYTEDNSVFADNTDLTYFADTKAERTLLNSKLKTIRDARLQINETTLGKFNRQLKEIETILKEASDRHTESIRIMEKAKGVERKTPKSTLTLKIVAKDQETYDLILKFALEHGCSVEGSKTE